MLTFYQVILIDSRPPHPYFLTQHEAEVFAARHCGVVVRDFDIQQAICYALTLTHLEAFDAGIAAIDPAIVPTTNAAVEQLRQDFLRLTVRLWPTIADDL